MFKFFNNLKRKGQSTLEYAILIIIILGALLAIQVYIKRGVQGRFKQAADDIGDQFSTGNTNVIHIVTTTSQTLDAFDAGTSKSQLTKQETVAEQMNSFVVNQDYEYWGG